MAYTPSAELNHLDTGYSPDTSLSFYDLIDNESSFDRTLFGISGIFNCEAGFNTAELNFVVDAGYTPNLLLSFDSDNQVVNFSETLGGLSGVFSGSVIQPAIRPISTQYCCGQKTAKKISEKHQIDVESAAYISNKHVVNFEPGIVLSLANHHDQQSGAAVDFYAHLDSETAKEIEQGFKHDQEAGLSIDIPIKSQSQTATRVLIQSHHDIQDTKNGIHQAIREREGIADYAPFYAVEQKSGDYTPVSTLDFTGIYLLEFTEKGGFSSAHHARVFEARHIDKPVCDVLQNADSIKVKSRHNSEQAEYPRPGKTPWIDPPREPPTEPPTQPPAFVVPFLSTYYMKHTITCTLPDLTPVAFNIESIDYDVDSFAYRFSGTLVDKSHLPLITQTGTNPVILHITINGYPFHMIVRRISHVTRFGSRKISVTGVGLSALLGEPFERPTSGTQGSDLTVQQIADTHVPAGWTLNWTAQTWLVTGGAYSYQNATYIQALRRIAENIGAALVPARDRQELTMQPRYPDLPWNFATATPDIIINQDLVDDTTEENIVDSQINGIYVHGSEIGGIQAFCRLNGTAGDRLIQTESNGLITDVIGARALGERRLAGAYTQPAIKSFSMPLDDGTNFPLVEIGDLIEIQRTIGNVRGVVNSVKLKIDLPKIRQVVTIGEETPNSWTAYNKLVETSPLLIGTVASVSGETSVVSLLDGGTMRVRGTGAIGSKYYVRNGVIEGQAPSLPLSEIVI